MKAFLQYNLGWDDYSLYMRTQERMPTQLRLSKLEWVSHQQYSFAEPVKNIIDGQDYSDIGTIPMRDFVQAIMDEGWAKGIRPLGFQDVKNETTAIREHLADMRAIAFTQIGMVPPEKK